MSNDTTPLILVAALGGAGLVWLLRRREIAPASAARRDRTPTPAPEPLKPETGADTAGAWFWPVPILNGHRPVVSDGWGSSRDAGARTHAGVDLMFLRAHAGDLVREYPPNTPSGTPHYFMGDGCPALAASAGRVWSAGWSPRGYSVVIDHGRWATFYQHLERLLVAPRHGAAGGPPVTAGQPIGFIGGSPQGERLKHLHFELRIGQRPIDPEPFLRRWQLVEVHTQAAGAIAVALHDAAGTTRGPARWASVPEIAQ